MRKIFVYLLSAAFYFIAVQCQHREYYDLLEVSNKATEDEIKKAYRKLSKKYHPDRNQGDEKAQEKFVKIANAYEVLSDSEKRRKYDQYGPEFEKMEGQQASGFDDFFGFGDPFGGGRRERKGPDLRISIPVKLEDIYNGKEIEMFQTKQTICPHCRGTGADDPDDVKTCPVCNGQGHVLKKQQIAPGFFTQTQAPCDKCNGKGKIYKSKCHVCSGHKVVPGMDTFTIFIEKGIEHGKELRYKNQGNEFHDQAPSDIVFIVNEQPHPVFQRKKTDLYTTVKLTLKEALLGFTKTIPHLDGHDIVLERSTVTQPGEVQKLKEEGMPQHEYSSYHGDLYVTYQVEFPSKFNSEQMKLWQEFFANK